MVTRSQHKRHDKGRTDSVPVNDSKNFEKKSTTSQEYRKMLGKRLYELESESMPAT